MKKVVCKLSDLLSDHPTIRSVSQLQRMTGLSRRTLDKLYHNESSTIGYETVSKICEAVDCRLEELLVMVNEDDYKTLEKTILEKTNELRKGFVYFIKDKSTGLIKIGRTNDMSLRFKQLEKEYGDLEILGQIQTDNTVAVEKTYHDRFALQRVEGEWFDIKDRDVIG